MASQDFSDEDLDAMGLSRADVATAAWWVEPGSRPAAGAEAISRALVAIGGVPGLTGRVIWFPLMRPLARRVYRWIADNRPTVGRWLRRLPGGRRSR